MTGSTKDINQVLIERCKRGEHAAFNELYNMYSKAMYSISMRILNKQEEAEDVLQEAFLKAFSNIRNFDHRVSFGAWLKRIVINQSIDAARKLKPEAFIENNDYPDPGEYEEEQGQVYDLETVKQKIQELPDGYRIVLTLFLFENFTHKGIALQLGISEGTSKSQYNRARKKLQQLMLLQNTNK